jgi:hypothetical protein
MRRVRGIRSGRPGLASLDALKGRQHVTAWLAHELQVNRTARLPTAGPEIFDSSHRHHATEGDQPDRPAGDRRDDG